MFWMFNSLPGPRIRRLWGLMTVNLDPTILEGFFPRGFPFQIEHRPCCCFFSRDANPHATEKWWVDEGDKFQWTCVVEDLFPDMFPPRGNSELTTRHEKCVSHIHIWIAATTATTTTTTTAAWATTTSGSVSNTGENWAKTFIGHAGKAGGWNSPQSAFNSSHVCTLKWQT